MCIRDRYRTTQCEKRRTHIHCTGSQKRHHKECQARNQKATSCRRGIQTETSLQRFCNFYNIGRVLKDEEQLSSRQIENNSTLCLHVKVELVEDTVYRDEEVYRRGTHDFDRGLFGMGGLGSRMEMASIDTNMMSMNRMGGFGELGGLGLGGLGRLSGLSGFGGLGGMSAFHGGANGPAANPSGSSVFRADELELESTRETTKSTDPALNLQEPPMPAVPGMLSKQF
eukprot:TRINITY_DN10599_c0_g1_i8.p1 TRINITY_DN10599_c0_g1~~TRINITY_DN10599_c0_g1_i8.p1  ORF type:complete len:227 (+),score=8.90 TRINITY_DN10599_c0_g1_i8:75-755(+)